MSVWAVRRYGLEFAKALQLLTEGQEFGPGGALCRAALALALARTDPEAAQGVVLPRNGASVAHDAWAEAWRSHAQAEPLRREGGGPLEVAAEEARWALRAHDDAAAAACTAELAADIAAACGRTALAVELLCSGDALRDGHRSGAAYCAPVPRRCETALRDVVGAEAERTTA
ncbi:hypothetical protein ACFVY1_39740 [Streptomyces sp. NPDC058293]|uniref:hypothetical protein n=1 Tax=Streptomyces sp. NPDC058293 TaxID=3346429 RepID=UPI0036E01A36